MSAVKSGLLAAAALLAFTSMASSADLATGPIYKAPPPPPPAFSWTGFYVGGHFGGGWARSAWENRGTSIVSGDALCFLHGGAICPLSVVDPSGDIGSHNAVGVLGGIQAGFNWQTGRWVLGIEAQYSFANLKGDHGDDASGTGLRNDGTDNWLVNTTLNGRNYSKVSGIGTFAARLGFASEAFARTLFYVKGGAAYARDKFWAKGKLTSSGCDVVDQDECFAVNSISSWSASQDRWGWMAGIGLEFGLTNNVSAKIEYDYLDFGSRDIGLEGGASGTCAGNCGTNNLYSFNTTVTRNLRIAQNIQLVKLGLNYRFGGAGY